MISTEGQIEIPLWAGRAIDANAEPWFRFRRVLRTLGKCVDVPQGARWLDVGCQMGQFLNVARHNLGVVPYGIDDFRAEDAAAVCAKHLNLRIVDPAEIFDGSWSYFQRRIERVGFALDDRFDFVSALEVLEHFVDTDAFLEECRNHLVSKGWLIITTPNINSLRNRVMVPLGYYPASMEYRTEVHHVRLYNPTVLKSHVESHGFRLVRMDGVTFLPRRMLGDEMVCRLDNSLSTLMPSLCGNMIAVFQKLD